MLGMQKVVCLLSLLSADDVQDIKPAESKSTKL
jgi:hypothetical protein